MSCLPDRLHIIVVVDRCKKLLNEAPMLEMQEGICVSPDRFHRRKTGPVA